MPGRLNPVDAATRSALQFQTSGWTDQFFSTAWPKDFPWIAITDELRAARTNHTSAAPRPFSWEDVKIKKEDIPAKV